MEGFAFIPSPPHSRTEFILRVYDEYLRVHTADPDRAKLLNIRYTGLQAYSLIEGYERMKAACGCIVPSKIRNRRVRVLRRLTPPFLRCSETRIKSRRCSPTTLRFIWDDSATMWPTKADIAQLRSEFPHGFDDLKETMRDGQTELLRAFYNYAQSKR